MGYMTMEEQIASHLAFLKKHNFAVDELRINCGFVRCHAIGKITGRGELCYQTKTTQLNKGLIGLGTWLRSEGGQVKIHKTYGSSSEESWHSSKEKDAGKIEEAEKAVAFWEMSDQIGEAEYLLKKGVGYYGIRFRQTEYGKIAVIPLRDIAGRLYSYQLINADGSKRFAKNIETKGLLHMLHNPIEGYPIGLAESYVTAASCFEITGLAMVAAFSAENLKPVGIALRRRFPKSSIIIFGDNDRHLEENKGAKMAYAVQNALKTACQVAMPEFNEYPASREFSDWNDYVREKGVQAARTAIRKAMSRGMSESEAI
jgi:phage/plasmid primase-like uncharacterized protein